MWYVVKEDELYHHGIKGQKWGVRRFQNPDGTLTAKGRKRYGYAALDKMEKTRTNFGAALKADSAARKRSGSELDDAIKSAKSIRQKAHLALGYTGQAKMYGSRASAYNEASARMAQQGRMKAAIASKATAKRNEAFAKANANIASTKGLLNRYAKIMTTGPQMTMYSNVGRKYVRQNEGIKNMLTMGVYGFVADSKYKKAYSEEERLSRMK